MGSFKFEMGEVVIIQSDLAPECNGVAVVSNRSVVSLNLKNGAGHYHGNAYQIEDHPYHEDGWFIESSLRKKHQPGEMDFHQLMETLVIKEKV